MTEVTLLNCYKNGDSKVNKFFIILTIIGLNSCVVIDNSVSVLNHNQHNLTSSETHHIHNPKPDTKVIIPPVIENPSNKKQCEPFVLPTRGTIPATLNIDDPNIKSHRDMELALATYIVILEEYIWEELTLIDQQYNEYKTKCGF